MLYRTRLTIFALVVVACVLLPRSARAAEIVMCHKVCVCYSWVSGSTGYYEVRCPDGSLKGWTPSPPLPPDGRTGSWKGSGALQNAPSTLPGQPLYNMASMAVSSAKSEAIDKLRGEKVPDMKGVWEPNDCTRLFADNPMGRSGAYLLGSYVIFRDGTGVKDAAGVNQCATASVSAWTKCCQHERVIFICPSQFVGLSAAGRITKVIHETLHVAGQFENTNGTVGPGDPPNPSQIDALVNEACN